MITYVSKRVDEKIVGDETEKKIKTGIRNIMQNQLSFYKKIQENNGDDDRILKTLDSQ